MPRSSLAVAILRAFVPPAERAEVVADLTDELLARVDSHGSARANAWLWMQLFRSLPSLIRRSWWRSRTGFDSRANVMNPGGPRMERWLLELRYAARRLRTRPGYTQHTDHTQSHNDAGMAAISGIARALLLDPLPYYRSDQLAEFWAGGDWRPNEVAALRGHFDGFDAVAAYRTEDVTLEREGATTRLVPGIATTPELIRVLGVKPLLGRGFVDGEDLPSAAPTAVLSYELWQDLGGRQEIVGSQLKLDGVSRTVIGVMPKGFWFPYPTIGVWISETFDPKAAYGIYNLIGRVGAGHRVDGMQPTVDRITKRLAGQFKYSVLFDKTRNAGLVSVRERAVQEMRPALLATLAGMAVILLIACSNVAALILGQVEGRSSELALRAALGADRSRLSLQLLLEVVMLGSASGVVGTVFATGGFALLRRALPLGPWADRAALDWRLFALTMVVAIVAAVVIALIPISSVWRRDLQRSLAGARTGGVLRNRSGLQGAMVVSEVALAVLLASAAGLLVRSVAKLYAIRPGFETRGLAVLDTPLPAALKPEDRRHLLDNLVRELARLPGVQSAGITQKIPLRGRGWSSGLSLPDAPPDAPSPYFRIVSRDYLRTLGVPLRRGRLFDGSERPQDSIASIIVNEALVKTYFPTIDPIGRVVHGTFGQSDRIIGVVADVVEGDLKDRAVPARYYSADQLAFIPDVQTVVLRTTRPEDDERVLQAARQTIARVAPSVAVQEATTMSHVLDRAIGPARDVMTLLGLLTGLALLLGAVGIYGVISQFVSRRSREWSIRVALGLAPSRVVSYVVRHGASLVVVGIALGIAGAVTLTRLLATFLYGVTATDPTSMIAAALVLLSVGIVAALIPALRASRTDPALVLRQQ